MKKVMFIFAILLLISSTGFCQDDAITEKLTSLFQQEKYKKVIKYKQGKIEEFGSKALFIKAMGYYYLEDDNNALKYFDLAITKGPVDGDMYFYKGITLFYLERYNESIKDFKKTLEIMPGESDLYAMMGESYMQLEMLDSALFFLNEATLFDECNVRVHYLMGDIFQQQKKYDFSMVSFKLALKMLEPGTIPYRTCNYNIGLMQHLSNNLVEAEATFLKHIEMYPDDYAAVSKLIQVYFGTQQIEKSNPLKEILYKAHRRQALPKNMRAMFCFEQFQWNEKTVFAFELFDEFEDRVTICKHKFIVEDDANEDEITYKVQSELDTVNGESTYVLRFLKNDTLFTYNNYLFKDDIDYGKLKSAVLDILNGSVEPEGQVSPYSEWHAARRAELNNLKGLKNDGSSFEKAIFVKSIPAEYQWLHEFYPGHLFLQQSLRTYEGKPYDVMKIKTAEGDTIEVYFDISDFFGKDY